MSPTGRRIMLAAAAALTLAACAPPDAPANPTPGQTWQQPGNEDVCQWDGSRWVETDDGEDCEDGGDSHKRKRPTVVVPGATRTVRPAAPTIRRAERPTVRKESAPQRRDSGKRGKR